MITAEEINARIEEKHRGLSEITNAYKEGRMTRIRYQAERKGLIDEINDLHMMQMKLGESPTDA